MALGEAFGGPCLAQRYTGMLLVLLLMAEIRPTSTGDRRISAINSMSRFNERTLRKPENQRLDPENQRLDPCYFFGHVCHMPRISFRIVKTHLEHGTSSIVNHVSLPSNYFLQMSPPKKNIHMLNINPMQF